MKMVLSHDKSSDKKVLTYSDSPGHPLSVDSALLVQINRHGYNAVLDIMPTFPGSDKVAAAIKSVEEMPRWNPGMQNALPLKVQYTIPIQIKSK